MVQLDYSCSDSISSCSFCSSSVDSSKPLDVPVDFSYKRVPSDAVRRKLEFIKILSDHRQRCNELLDKIDLMIENRVDINHQELLSRKYVLLQNGMMIQKRCCEVRDEIQTLKVSISNESVKQVQLSADSRAIFICFVFLIYFVLSFMVLGRL